MYYTVYKVTNLINNKIYIGVHKTNNINDDYMGSGKYLKRAQEKYGIENFKKEIIEVFDNTEDMFNMESQLVNEDFVKDTETYNLKVGGEGGWSHLNDGSEAHIARTKLGGKISNENGSQEKAQEALKWLRENDPIWLENRNNKIRESLIKYYECKSGAFTGKKHSKESKKRIGEANSKLQKGEGNSQFGTMWIHSLTEKVSKKIKKEEFPEFETQGWLKGRKMKF